MTHTPAIAPRKSHQTIEAHIPPEPRIEVAPYEQLQQLRVKEDHILNSYAYVDKESGVVRVPIDKAIDMLQPRAFPPTTTWMTFLPERNRPLRPSSRMPRRPVKQRRKEIMRSKKLWISGIILAALPSLAAAQQLGIPSASLPSIMQGVGIDQNLNAQIPLELTFKDENGQVVRLGQYFREKPVMLALVYYECPMLCNMILNGLTHSYGANLAELGTDYEVVAVSFNPKETWQLANAKKANYLEKYQRQAPRGMAFPDRRGGTTSRDSPTRSDSITATIPSSNSTPTPAASW